MKQLEKWGMSKKTASFFSGFIIGISQLLLDSQDTRVTITSQSLVRALYFYLQNYINSPKSPTNILYFHTALFAW